jgi:hypothetical protein
MTSANWRPVSLVRMWDVLEYLPQACTCDRRLIDPHYEPSCPYIDPDDWYAAEVARMAERSPA